MANLSQLKGSFDLAQMNHSAMGTDQTAAALEAAQSAYEAAAGNDVDGGVVDERDAQKAKEGKEALAKLSGGLEKKQDAAGDAEKKSEE